MLNNIEELTKKVDDIVAILRTYVEEVKIVEAGRVALEKSSQVSTARETRLNERDIQQKQKEQEQQLQTPWSATSN